MRFSDVLYHWYEENRRTLPWRGDKDPYKIWVSEIILQQTRVNQGWNYYLRFIEKFPDIRSLANAPMDEILKVWQGLGYYSRARNMHEAAKTVTEEYGGTFPRQYEEIKKLKGIGDYTAAAIASIAFDLPYPAVDGNVFRVISRIFGIHDDIMLPLTKKKVTAKCGELMEGISPGIFNEAMMDFGSLQCVPRNPQCNICPFQNQCYAYRHQEVDLLPVKIKKVRVSTRYFHYLVYIKEDTTVIRQRDGNDIWKGLYEFPLIESGEIHSEKLLAILDHYHHSRIPAWSIRHQLTHQRIYAFFYVIPVKIFPEITDHGFVVDFSKLNQYPFPKIIADFIGKYRRGDPGLT